MQSRKTRNFLFDYYHFSKAEEKKYPIISKTLRALTPREIEKRIKATTEMPLPPEVQKLVDDYDKVGIRNGLTWKRTYRHSCLVNFSETTDENRDFLINTKFLSFMFIILLDDVADVWRSKKLLEEILKIPYEEKYINLNKLNAKEKEYLRFTMRIWKLLIGRLKTCPHYKEFEDVYEYNIRQMLLGRRYGFLVGKYHRLINRTENRSYLQAYVCSMQILSDFIIDFMFAPNLSVKEYGKVRELIGRTQEMTRRGNWVSGWIKEVEEKDFSSGVIAYAMDEGVITPEDLADDKYLGVVDKIRKSNVEKELLIEWEENYHKNIKTAKEIKSTDAKKYVEAIAELLGMVLTSSHAQGIRYN